jgi:predicted Zn-dependent protease
MKTKLAQAAVCIAFLTMAPAASAQYGITDGRPKIDSTKMDKYIKSYQDAVKYYQKGQLKLAEKELTEFLNNVGEHAGANFLMGMVQVQQGDLVKARSSFITTVKLDPTMVAPHGWLGAIEAVLGNPSGAAAQKAALEQMKAQCAGTCPKAGEIAEGIQRIDDNVAAAAAPAKPS